MTRPNHTPGNFSEREWQEIKAFASRHPHPASVDDYADDLERRIAAHLNERRNKRRKAQALIVKLARRDGVHVVARAAADWAEQNGHLVGKGLY